MLKKTILSIFLFGTILTYSQVGIGTVTPEPEAILDIYSEDKGILIPRVVLISRDNISPITGPATTGLMVFNTNTVGTTGLNAVSPGFYYWDATSLLWMRVATGGAVTKDWSVTGNGDIDATTDLLGTMNNQDLVIVANGIERIRVDVSGSIGVGTSLPDSSAALDLVSNNQGLLVPRLTLIERAAITLPAKGLLIYNLDWNEFQVNTGTSLVPIWESILTNSTVNQSVKYSNTDITTNVNPATAINLPVVSTEEWNDNTALYIANTTSNSIEVTQDGRYTIILNVSLISINQRPAPEVRIAVNGISVGPYSSTGYIRSLNGHNTSSLHLNETLNLAANDVITIQIIRTANTGAVQLRSAGTTNLMINKVK